MDILGGDLWHLPQKKKLSLCAFALCLVAFLPTPPPELEFSYLPGCVDQAFLDAPRRTKCAQATFLEPRCLFFFKKGPRPTEACWCLLCSCRECAGQKAVKSSRRGAQGKVRTPEIFLGRCQDGTSRNMHTQDDLPGPPGSLPGPE